MNKNELESSFARGIFCYQILLQIFFLQITFDYEGHNQRWSIFITSETRRSTYQKIQAPIYFS